jgi:hypothetical protein
LLSQLRRQVNEEVEKAVSAILRHFPTAAPSLLLYANLPEEAALQSGNGAVFKPG